MQKEDMTVFANCHLFEGLSREQAEHAIDILHPTVAEFPAGSVIFREGEFLPSLIYILSGTVAVEKKDAEKKVLLNLLGAGDTFGAASMFGKCRNFPTKVSAKTKVRIAAMDEHALTAMFMKLPATAVSHIRYLSDKIRFLNRKLEALTGRTAESKVSDYLLHTYGKLTCQSPLNMVQTSHLLDMGRATLYRILNKFDEQGLIRFRDGSISILKTEELEMLIK